MGSPPPAADKSYLLVLLYFLITFLRLGFPYVTLIMQNLQGRGLPCTEGL